MIFGTCNIDSTYVKSKLRRFDILRAAKIETTVESILAAPDLLGDLNIAGKLGVSWSTLFYYFQLLGERCSKTCIQEN